MMTDEVAVNAKRQGALATTDGPASVSPASPECRMGAFRSFLHSDGRSASFCHVLRNLKQDAAGTIKRFGNEGRINDALILNRPMRDHMISIIPTEFIWLASGFIMLMAAFLAAAAE
jgi:hypothetical protein